MTVSKKVTGTKAVAKPKAPTEPKPFEIGYEFNIKAKIVEVHPEEDKYHYPFKVEVNLGEFDDMEDHDGCGAHLLFYRTKQDLLNILAKTVPALAKAVKQEELNKAKAEVDRLTKELATIK